MTIEILISFTTGVILTIGGAWISNIFQNRQERRKKKEEIRFEIYMNLLDISEFYFWVSTAELHNEATNPQTKKLIRDLAFKTSDKLRQVDNIEYQDEILNVLFSEHYKSAQERADKLNELLEKLHDIVSPKFIKKIKEISQNNMKLLSTQGPNKFNAPGNLK